MDPGKNMHTSCVCKTFYDLKFFLKEVPFLNGVVQVVGEVGKMGEFVS